ncbi:MAG: glutamine hydrolyzing CTP synthase [Candidatus Zixiibacteriota bacterium]
MGDKTKFIIITGGVLSGLGKGVAAASIGHLLSSNLRVIPVKCDGYLNTDPGTMNPIEHGEVFVLDDGGEVDMDFGHYERFLDVECKSEWNLTMGKVFKKILEKERRGDFLGGTVQFIPHVTDTIKDSLKEIAHNEKADILLVEIGGTVGDLENELYIEAVRQLGQEKDDNDVVYIHLTYVPIPENTGEQKSKPSQQSVKLLNERGIFPDILIGRCSEPLEEKIKNKIALFCNLPRHAVISGVDVSTVYKIPLFYDEDGMTEIFHKELAIYSPPDLSDWTRLVRHIEKPSKNVTLAISGKYTELKDSYASIIEALAHAGAHLDAKVDIKWIETTDIEKSPEKLDDLLEDVNGVIVPGGFGTRGIEGKIEIIRYVRENDIPFLGICYGMQLAVIEFARNVCEIGGANTSEVEDDGCEVDIPIVCILESQKKVKQKGGTMRLGGQDVKIKPHTRANKIYGKTKIRERFRHRYEINPEYIGKLEKKGMIFSGHHPKEKIKQIMEIPGHRFYIGTQFHPELKSTLKKPAPLFYHLVEAAITSKTIHKP